MEKKIHRCCVECAAYYEDDNDVKVMLVDESDCEVHDW